jgi:hypothetical protein
LTWQRDVLDWASRVKAPIEGAAVKDRVESHYLLIAGTFLPDLEVVMFRSSWIHWSVLAGLVFFVGCGDKAGSVGTVPVTGLVTLDGQPVTGAAVSFSPTDKGGRAAVGTTDDSGRYTLTTMKSGDGAVPGSYTVMITKSAANAGSAWTDPRSSGSTLTPEQQKEIMEMAKSGKKVETKSDIPAKYASAATSGFTATVASGQPNDFPFAMTK